MESWRLDLRAIAGLGAVVAVWASSLAAYAATRAPAVALAAAIDLTITATAALYLIAVRGGHLAPRALWPVGAAGLVAARVLVGSAVDTTHAALAVAAVLELLAAAVIALRVRRARTGWRTARAGGAARLDALDAALTATGLPRRIAGAIASELGVVGCALTGWRRPRVAADTFTVHRVNGWTLYAGVFALLTIAETPVVHLALAAFGHSTAAWIATGLALYSALWLVGDAHALRHGGVVLGRDALELRLGVRWRGRIARAAIAHVERGSAPARAADFSILGATVVLHLREPVTLHGLAGRRRTTDVIALSIDDADRFLAVVDGSAP
jgi:hypothetical protein